ncbi:conserved hypothetical protein [Culex quinquefasciatus]|uniref:Uncharacterized protein n=1 Tax=Culex quinquefasciatus TaxID=7176 RepID=B0VZ99_CULQU|nr:conserved hypothetical protein [Culex quinquefasciatus]|eukprot:XP_001841706.1 conserved hypothetical protein [Culex quinquefasciatus]
MSLVTCSNPHRLYTYTRHHLPLLLTAVNEGCLSLEDFIAKFYKNPKRNFGLPEQPNTYVEVDFNEEWIIPEVPPHHKAR